MKKDEMRAAPAAAAPAGPLRRETVTVRMVPRKSEMFEGEKHVLSGGMADRTRYWLTVPKGPTGGYVQVLTAEEQEWCEGAMGLPPGAMSPHKAEGNFWSSRNPLANIELGKEDRRLDLSSVEDYIRYKILLTNGEVVCRSIDDLEKRPKETYRFVLVRRSEEQRAMNSRVDTKMECYREFGKIEDDAYKMRVVIELLDNSVLSGSTSAEWLREQCVNHIDGSPKRFLQVVKDPLLDDKILIKRLVEAGVVSNRSGRMFVRKDGTPMCDGGEEATLAVAARWIGDPRRQELRLLLEAQLEGRA